MRRLIFSLFLALILWAQPALAAVAHVASGCAAGNGTLAQVTINTTGATLIVVAIADYSGDDDTPTDSQSNTWDATIPEYTNTFGDIRLWFDATPTTNASHTFTYDQASTFPSICVIAFSGTGAYDGQQNGANNAGGSTTVQPGSITPSQDNTVVVTALVMDTATTATISAGYDLVSGQIAFETSVKFGIAIAYDIQTTATATNPTWTLADSTTGTATIAAFREGAAAGGAPKNFLLLGVGAP